MTTLYLGTNAKQHIINAGIPANEIADYISIDKFKEQLIYNHSKFNLEALNIFKDDMYNWHISLNDDAFEELKEER